MAYQNNIPQATDALSQSQSDILNNFAAISTFVNVNHVDFASVDQGKHKFITFPVQVGAPVFAAGEVGLYNLLNGTTAQNELYLTNSSGTSYPITAAQTTGAPTATAGWTYLASGMKMVWGQATIVAGGTITVAYASVAGFPGFTTAVMLPQLTRIVASTATNFVSVAPKAAPDLLGFRAFSSAGQNNVVFGWMTIGR